MKNIVIFLLMSILSSTSLFALGCCTESDCDATIEAAMEKQRDTIKDRLDDFKNVIHANMEQTKNQSLIIEQGILAAKRLKARIVKETLLLDKAKYLMRQIKDNTSLNVSISLGGK